MLRIILAFWIAILPLAGADAEEIQFQQTVDIDRIEAERRDQLLADIVADDRTTRRVAVAELRGGFSEDPVVIERLLDGLSALAGTRVPPPPLSTEARINVLFLLANAGDAAWTPDTVAAAQEALKTYGQTGSFEMGPQEAGLAAELEARLTDLSGTRVLFGEIQGRVETKLEFADVDLFVCDYASDDADLVRLTRDFAESLVDYEFGRIRVREASEKLFESVKAGRAATTIIFDEEHPEEKAARQLAELVATLDLPPPQILPNPGAASLWYLSVFVCP